MHSFMPGLLGNTGMNQNVRAKTKPYRTGVGIIGARLYSCEDGNVHFCLPQFEWGGPFHRANTRTPEGSRAGESMS